jgi:hypothetical protein
LGGEDDDETAAVMGDFNGDGKPDVAKIVSNAVSCTNTFQVAVLLSNGDGTFKTAAVTNTDGNTDDPIVVGDLKGDSTDDLIQVHPVGDNCDGPQSKGTHPLTLPSCGASIDVMVSNGDGTFATPVNYPVTGASLTGGLLTDVNGDGKLDVLVFDDSTPANVIELLGNGDGTFQAASTLGHLTTNTPRNMIFADFNGDGKIDFAGQLESGQLQVTLATGAGLFANAPVSLATEDGSYGACNSTAGDLTGDSKPEIVSFNCDANTVTVYVNNGEGTFSTGHYYDNLGSKFEGIDNGAIADMNGDGKNDIVAINDDVADVSVFLGNGDGTVAVLPQGYDVGGFAWQPPLVADFNGDGLMDVVSSDDEFNLVYLQGYGDGTFRGAPTYVLPNSFNQDTFTYSVATGDFNGDGIADVVVGQADNAGSTGVAVYLGKGDGTFFPGVTYGASTEDTNVAVADFNGDGILDIASIDRSSQEIDIFLGNGDGTFNVAGSYACDTQEAPEPTELVLGDFNKDGKMDIAVTNFNTSDVGILLGNGDGTFAAPVTYPVGEGYRPEAIAAGDLNGDGFLDLAVPSFNGDQPILVIMLGKSDSSGTFQAPTSSDINGLPNEIAVGDLNKDGKLDLAVSEFEGTTFNGQVEVLLGKGDGTFNAPVAYTASAFGGASGDSDPAGIQVADMNGDGNLDLVYINNNWGTLAVATGVGDGTLNAPVEVPTSEDTWGMALTDVNGDGAVDVLTGEDDSGGFSVLLNGIGTGAAPNFTVGTKTPSQTVASGASATYTLNLAGTNGYTGTITFSCGNLPTGATCTFNPASVAAKSGEALSTTVTVSTTASASANLLGPSHPGTNSTILLASLSGMGLFGLMLGGGRKRNIRIVSAMMVILLMGTLVGCSGTSTGKSSGKATPAGSYVVTVTSTGSGTAAPTHSTNLILVVQ